MSLRIDISVCRVCCKSDASNSILKYAKKFYYCTSIEVEANDGLPDKICGACLDRLKIAVEFKKKSEFSDRQLKSFIRNVNNQFMALEGSDAGDMECDEDEEVLQMLNKEPQKLPQDIMVSIPKRSASSMCSSNKVERQSICEEAVSTEPEVEEIVESNMIPNQTLEPDLEPELETETLGEAELENEPEPVPETEPEQEQEKFRAVAVIQEKPVVKPEKELYEVVELEYDDNMIQHNDVIVVEEPQVEQRDSTPNGSETGEESQQVIYIGFTSDYQDNEDEEEMDVRNSEAIYDIAEKQKELPNANMVKENYDLISKTSTVSSSTGGRFDCLKCRKSFSTKTNLNRHVQSHNGNKPFVCPLCQKGFTQAGSLKQHLLIHQNLRPFVCSVCDQGFTQQKSLTFHMRRHTNEKPFVCPHCSYAFRQKDGLKRHLLVKHSANDAKMFDCDLCEKSFKTKYAMTVHRKRHDAGLLGSDGKKRKVLTDEMVMF
ncbi:zinc finger protein 2-like [Armigeres subalbatus]|uniref:zinc finger protein 2-like n=1 Tax=Armigeres subalbatus TaxID=124917 RepID=UPI002ED20141